MTADTAREELHQRRIELRFFRRADGLYDIEGQLLDRKTHAFRRQLADEDTPAGTPLHDIMVRLVIDDAMLIHDAQARMATTPFDICQGAEHTLAPLKGLHIGAGWMKQVREHLHGSASCTHIVELLSPMATCAFQGLAPQQLTRINMPGSDQQRLAKIDSCYAYAAERKVVAQLWPYLHKPSEKK